jgi:hypothetical protein
MERRPALASRDGAPSDAIFPRGGVVSPSILLSEKRNQRYGVFELFRPSPGRGRLGAVLFGRNSEDETATLG